MCGFIAHLALREKAKISEPILSALNELLFHRGPDSGGTYLNGSVALGVRRLAIIDLATGNQPIFSDDKRYVIVFNGEIYNYEALRERLIGKGYRFRTHSDTETLLYSYIDEGPECLSRLNGMFAFAIWDEQKKELFLARDRMGIKPLYYCQNNDRVLFSSELTPFYRSGFFDLRLNIRSISNYLAYWYICEPDTIFEDIFQLPPGTFALVREGKMTVTRYWSIPADPEENISFSESAERLAEMLEDAVKLRMKVDVPIGTFLSGGIDSGLITTIAARHIPNRLKSFAIGFKEKTYSELPLAQTTAQKYGVNLSCLQIDDIRPETLEKIFTSFDEPLGNASFVPTYLLAQMARREVKVVLTGDGGDELFGGYPTYSAPYYLNFFQRMPAGLLRKMNQLVNRFPVSHNRISFDYRLKQLMRGISFSYQRAHYTWREVIPLPAQQSLFHPEIWQGMSGYDPFSVDERYFQKSRSLSVINQLMFVDLNTYLLNDHLRKIDRMTMAHSLEARVPYLDHRIVELAMRLPAEYKINFLRSKRILKHIARNKLPREVLRAGKKGLTSPIAGWIAHQLRDYIPGMLTGGVLDDLFDRRAIQKILREHFEKKKDNSRAIWALLTLQGWSQNLKKGKIV
ncbi:MAG: asparagine synthase (glutamine-hydrolyzing) [Candidatus Omnitrophota bacterium]